MMAEDGLDEEIWESSRLFDTTATSLCSRTIVVFLVAAVVVCFCIMLALISGDSWKIYGTEILLIICVVLVASVNAALVVCWWCDCSWMAGKRFVCATERSHKEHAAP